jgi:hypothetical protein
VENNPGRKLATDTWHEPNAERKQENRPGCQDHNHLKFENNLEKYKSVHPNSQRIPFQKNKK